MHGWDRGADELFAAVAEFVAFRMRMDPPPLDRSWTPAALAERAGQTITPEGLGGPQAMRLFGEVLARANISTDHPRSLAFIPNAPTEAASLFDLVVGASSIFGGSWLIGSGAVYAENQALRYVADLLGYPEGAGGVFTPGGTQGNLAALHTARDQARRRRDEAGLPRPQRWAVLASEEAHSSVWHVAAVMDVDSVTVPVSDSPTPGTLTGVALRRALERMSEGTAPFAVVGVAGSTNYGLVDRLDELADVCAEYGLWLHIDGAYGGGGLAAPSVRDTFAGIERSDSFIVDPHKWLFAPYDSCALIYRDPRLARAAHSQTAAYLDALHATGEWNPSDYAVHLSRRARGLPFWFSLATYGTDAYRDAVERTLAVARHAEQQIREREYLELVRDRQLSVVVFRRLGWSPQDYAQWSARLLNQGLAFVTPTKHGSETVTRLAVVNPRTDESHIDLILDTMS